MANVKAQEITTAIRDVIESGHGATRAIPSGTFGGGIFETLGTDAESQKAMVLPAAEAKIIKQSVNKASPPQPGSVRLYDLEIQVRLIRHINLEHTTIDAVRDDTKALAARDGDVLSQALGYPDNINTDAAGATTGLVSGMLNYISSDVGKTDVSESGVIVTVHKFTGVACVIFTTEAEQALGALLLETGGTLLLEDGGRLLLE